MAKAALQFKDSKPVVYHPTLVLKAGISVTEKLIRAADSCPAIAAWRNCARVASFAVKNNLDLRIPDSSAFSRNCLHAHNDFLDACVNLLLLIFGWLDIVTPKIEPLLDIARKIQG